MTDGNNRKKAQAVFFSLVMVLSMVGGTVALAGSAAAAAPAGGSLSDTVVQSDATVTIEGINSYNETATGNSLQIVVENTTDGDGNEDITNIDDATTADDSSWDVSFDVGADTTLQNGDTANVIIREIDSNTATLDDKRVGSIEVDDDEPTVTPNTPADGDVVNSQTQQITVDITDDVTANGDLSITANVDNNGNTNTYEINPDSTTTDGVDYDTGSGTLTIDPGNANIPQLQDGTVDLSVTASDVAGNENTTDYSFEVQTEGPSSTFSMSGSGTYSIGDEFVTSNENATLDVELTSDSNEIADDSVSVQITGPDGYDTGVLDYTADQYDNGTNTFSLTPEGGDNAFSSEGTYIVDVDFTDEAGTAGDVDYTFYVDTTGTTVNSVSVDDVREDQTVVNPEDGLAYVYVEVAEDGTLPGDDALDTDANSIEATVNVNGEDKQVVDNFNLLPDYDTDGRNAQYYGTLDLADTDYSGIENDSAIANVTIADDLAGNALQNPAAAASETTFDIDTDGPSVEVSSPGETLGGYVNLTTMVTSQSDVDSSTVEILVGQDSNSVVDLGTLDDAKDIDTSGYPDGTHTLRVTVNDDAAPDNVASDTASFTLDNQQAVDVQQPYLAAVDATGSDYPVDTGYNYPVDGQFNLSTDIFETPADADVTYKIEGQGVVEGSELQFDANDFDDGDTPQLTATANGFTAAVEVQVVAVKETGGGVTVTAGDGEQELDNPSTINVSVNRELTSLNATVSDADAYFSDQSVDLTGIGSNGDFSLSTESGGTYYYTADVPSTLRDGLFSVEVSEAISDTQTRDLGDTSAIFTVDNEVPSIIDADINGVGDDGRTQVKIQFSEPVSVTEANVENITAADGTAVNDGIDVDGSDGEVVVEFNDVLQTGDGLDVTYAEDTITEEHEVDDGDLAESNPEDLTQTVDTIDLQLSAGQNLVSVPAETGTVALSDLDTSNVETVYAWDEGSFTGFTPGDETSDLQALEGGQGYIVTMSADDEIPVQAYNKPGFTGDSSPMTDEPIEQGWNLIGHWQEAAQDRGTALNSLNTATYDASNVLGEQSDGDFSPVTQLHSGEGYWLYADQTDNYVRESFAGPASGTVQNIDTNVNYDSLAAALADVEEYQTLELGSGTFAQDRDSLTVSTNNIRLVGQGTGETKISANLDLAGSSIIVERIDVVANSPTGDVTLSGDQTTISSVNAEGTVSVTGSGASVTDSSAKSVTVTDTASGAIVTNTDVTESVSVSGSQTSLDKVSAGGSVTVAASATGSSLNSTTADGGVTVNNDDTSITGDSSVPADTIVNTDSGEQFETLNAAVDAANTGETIAFGSGTYTAGEGGTTGSERTIDVEGLTLEAPNAGTAGNSGERGNEAVINGPLMIGADDVTVDGFTINDADSNPAGPEYDLPSYGAVQLASGGVYGETADNAMIKNNIIIGGENNNPTNVGLLAAEGASSGVVAERNLFEGENTIAVATQGGSVTEIDNIDNTNDT